MLSHDFGKHLNLACASNCSEFVGPLSKYDVFIRSLHSEGLSKVVDGEGSHNFSSVWLDNTSEGGDGSGGSLFGQESEDSKHSSTSIVDLSNETGFLLLCAPALEEVEWGRVWDALGKSTSNRLK